MNLSPVVESQATMSSGSSVSTASPTSPYPPARPPSRNIPPSPKPAYDPPSAGAGGGGGGGGISIEASEQLIRSVTSAPRRLVARHEVSIRSATAWTVEAGQVFRLLTPVGPQVGDLNVWSRSNPRERFWASRTRQLHASHISVGSRLWSCLPYLRPLATITADSLSGGVWSYPSGDEDVSAHSDNGNGSGSSSKTPSHQQHSPPPPPPPPKGVYGCHDLLGTRCDPYVNTALAGGTFDYHCHSNLTRAVLPYGLAESDVHDVINVFQLTGLDERGRYWMGTSPARPGDYLEFLADTDLLCAMSACPGGDLSKFGWTGPDGDGDGDGDSGGDGGARAGAEAEAEAGATGSGAAGGRAPSLAPPTGTGGVSPGGRAAGKAGDAQPDPMLETCRPLAVEIYEFEDRESALRHWAPSQSPVYTGLHGLRMPVFGR